MVGYYTYHREIRHYSRIGRYWWRCKRDHAIIGRRKLQSLFLCKSPMFVAGVFIHKVLVFLFIIVVAVAIRPPLFILPVPTFAGA